MTGPDQSTREDGSLAPSQPPVVRGRRGLRPVRGRWTALVSVVLVIVGVAVVAATLPPPSSTPAPGSSDGFAIAPADAHSSSSFCAAGTGTTAGTTIFLTNTTSKAVSGVMSSVGPPTGKGVVAATHRTVVVPALGSAAVNPALGLPAGNNATSFAFAGGGVSVNQVVAGSGGWSTAPCASQISDRWAFAGGATTPGNALTLALFNPAVTQAVVNVSFLTAGGLIAPQAYQGLTVPSGGLVVENVGDFVQNAQNIATIVTAQSGGLVGYELQRWASGPAHGLSVRLGSPVLSTTWRFAQTTTAPGSAVDFSLANPASTPVTATFSVGLSSATVTARSITLPPLSTAVFAASSAAGWPQRIPYAVTVGATGPVVVGRSVRTANVATPPQWGSSSGTVSTAARWLVPGPGVVHAPGVASAAIKSLAVANPGPSTAHVVVSTLDASRTVATFTVGPGELTVLGSNQVGGLDTFTVTSSEPVNVEEDDGPAGAPGVVSSTGFPFRS
jgi:hypothetical protein